MGAWGSFGGTIISPPLQNYSPPPLRYFGIPLMFLFFTILAFVTRTYIGGGTLGQSSQSSLAMKIHRKSCAQQSSSGSGKSGQLSLFPNSGSLSSLHETALTSDAEDVRSSVSAYQPVTSHRKSSRRYVKNYFMWHHLVTDFMTRAPPVGRI